MAQKKKMPASIAARKGGATKAATKTSHRVAKVSKKPVQHSASAGKKTAATKSKIPPKAAQSGRVTKAAETKPLAKAAKAPSAGKPIAMKAAPIKAPVKAKPAKAPASSAARPEPKAGTAGLRPTGQAAPMGVAKSPAPGAVRAMPAALPKATAAMISAPSVPKDLAQKAVAARTALQPAPTQVVVSKKPVTQRHGFKTNEYIVYPAHGVGRIIGIEEQEIAGMSLELFVIQFEKDKLTLRVPTGKSQSIGMRKLSEDGTVQRAMDTLKGKARIKRTMWSRRAQEYEAKINSGDLVSIAEVVRDLYRAENQPEQSYSERQLYEAALDRMAREIAAVDHLDERGAVQRITEVLAKSAKGRRAIEESAEDIEEGSISAA